MVCTIYFTRGLDACSRFGDKFQIPRSGDRVEPNPTCNLSAYTYFLTCAADSHHLKRTGCFMYVKYIPQYGVRSTLTPFSLPGESLGCRWQIVGCGRHTSNNPIPSYTIPYHTIPYNAVHYTTYSLFLPQPHSSPSPPLFIFIFIPLLWPLFLRI